MDLRDKRGHARWAYARAMPSSGLTTTPGWPAGLTVTPRLAVTRLKAQCGTRGLVAHLTRGGWSVSGRMRRGGEAKPDRNATLVARPHTEMVALSIPG